MATPEEIPGLPDKWSKDKHLVFQAQMVFIRQASPSQEARWTLAPQGIRSPPRSHKPSEEFTGSREGGSAATMEDSGSHVKGTVGLVFRLLT